MRFGFLLSFLAVLALGAVPAGAQTKLSGVTQCAKAETEHAIPVGDRPNHLFMITQGKCTWTKPAELGGSQAKEELNTEFLEVTGNTARGRGYGVGTMAGGDKYHVRWQSTGTMKDGAPQSGECKWNFAGGTGKLKGLKGEGSCKGKFAADGSSTWEIEGTYALPQ